MSSDFELVQAVRGGDTEQFVELIRRHEVRVRTVCRSLLLDAGESDDAAQDVFVKAYESIQQYRDDVSFVAWLTRIAQNHCLDLLRRRSRRKTDSLDAMIDARGDTLAEQSSRDEQDTSDRMALARQALAALSPEYRQVLVLREVEGLSYEAIAEAMHCSLDSVKARLRRARESLLTEARHFSTDPTLPIQEKKQ